MMRPRSYSGLGFAIPFSRKARFFACIDKTLSENISGNPNSDKRRPLVAVHL